MPTLRRREKDKITQLIVATTFCVSGVEAKKNDFEVYDNKYVG